MSPTIKNFGRNIEFSATEICRPKSAEDVVQILAKYKGTKIRATGSLHAWSPAAVTSGISIDMSAINSVAISSDESTVTVGAGCKVKHLLTKLAERGLTLPSVGLIDEQSIAGATATGTHGSGKQSLSHFIVAASIAHYDSAGTATITEIDNGPELLAARCSLGQLGIIVSLTIKCRKQYNIVEHAKAYPTVTEVIAEEKNTPIQQFYLMPWSWTYFAHHRAESNQPRSKLAWFYRIYCFLVIDIGLHLAVFALAKLLRTNWATRFFFQRILPLTIVRNWHVVDESSSQLVMEHELFRHIEIEVFVRRSDVEPATKLLTDIVCVFGDQDICDAENTKKQLSDIGRLEELNSLRGSYCHHYPICYRRVLSDDTLISMSCPDTKASVEDWYAISFISYQWPSDREGFSKFAKYITTVVAEVYAGRCHWGKYNPLDRDSNHRLYPRLKEFQQIASKFDPDGAFSNDWFSEVI